MSIIYKNVGNITGISSDQLSNGALMQVSKICRIVRRKTGVTLKLHDPWLIKNLIEQVTQINDPDLTKQLNAFIKQISPNSDPLLLSDEDNVVSYPSTDSDDSSVSNTEPEKKKPSPGSLTAAY